MSTFLSIAMLSLAFVYIPAHAQSGPSNINISGALFDSSGTAITAASVNFKIELYDKTSSCLLYTEDHLGLDLSQTKGAFSIDIGGGSSIQNLIDSGSPAAMSSKVYENPGVIAGGWSGCPSGATLADGDSRVIRVKYNLGGGYVTMNPDVPMAAAAYSTVAQTLQGKRPADFIQVHDDVTNDLTQANVENVFSSTNYPKLTALLSGGSTDYISANPSAAVPFNGQRLTNVADPTAAQDAATKNYADSNLGGKSVDVSGVGPATGDGYTLIWDQATQKWTTGTPSATDNTKLPLAGGTMTGAITMGGFDLLATGHITMSPLKTLTFGTFTTAQETTLVGTLTAANAGASWYNSTTNTFKIWDGSAAISQTFSGATAGGDLTGTYPNPTIANDKITSAKVDSAGIGINRLVISDQTTGASLKFATCATNEVLRYEGVNGWICRDPSAIVTFPVTKVNGKTGDITLNANDLGLGTAALENVGTAAGEIPVLDAGGKIPSSMIPAASSPTWGDITNGAGKYMTYKPNNTACATNEILKFDGTNWICSDISALGTGDFMKNGSVAMTGNFNAGGNSILGNTTASANLTLESTSNATKGYVLIQPNGGNVGIGTATPAAMLDILQPVGGSAGATLFNVKANAANGGGSFSVDGVGNAYMNGTAAGYDTNVSASAISSAGGDLYLTTDFSLGTGTHNIILKPRGGGNVGIGTNAPARLLHVNGAARLTPTTTPASPAAGDLFFDSAASNALKFYDGSAWQTVGTGTGSGDFMKNGSVAMTGNFNAGGNSVLGNTTASANLTLESTSNATKGYVNIQPNGGNVGIGTTTPGGALQVSGANGGSGIFSVTDSSFAEILSIGTTAGLIRLNKNGGTTQIALGSGVGRLAVGSLTASSVPLSINGIAGQTGDLVRIDAGTSTTGSTFLIDAAGHVGIGTTTPTQALEVNGSVVAQNFSASASVIANGEIIAQAWHADNYASSSTSSSYPQSSWTQMRVKNPNASDGKSALIYIEPQNSSAIQQTAYIGAYSVTGASSYAPVMVFGQRTGNTAYNERMRIDASGNVGIGTDAPARLLHVSGAARLTPTTTPATPAAGDLFFDSAASNALKFYDGSAWQTVGTGTGNGDFKKDGSVAMTGNFNAGGNSVLGNTTASANLTLESTSNATKGYVNLQPNGGNVGIGTTTPTSALTVKGSGGVPLVNLLRTTDSADKAILGYTPSNALSISNVSWSTGMQVNRNDYSVTTYDGTTAVERMTITNSGNVGIGTATPARLLHVNGAARFTPTTTPATPSAGDMFFDSAASNAFKFYDGSAWQTVGTGTGNGDFMKNGSVAMTGNFNAVAIQF